jgi:transposase
VGNVESGSHPHVRGRDLFAQTVREHGPGHSESLMPKKAPGKERKLNRGATRLLEEDLHRRPEATHRQRAKLLFELLGARVSEPTVCRAVKRLNYTRPKKRLRVLRPWCSRRLARSV